MTREIAIIDPNTLSSLGLSNLLQELIPQAVIRSFSSFGKLTDDTPDLYAHYFVAAGVFFEHTAFFLERRHKTIVLTGSENVPHLQGMRSLNICQDEQQLAKSILQLHRTGHPHGSPAPTPADGPATHPGREEESRQLSAREVEVLKLIVRGLMNKEIADRLNIGLTTVISHRKNLTEKLGIKSVSGLTIYAVMQGYVEADSI